MEAMSMGRDVEMWLTYWRSPFSYCLCLFVFWGLFEMNRHMLRSVETSWKSLCVCLCVLVCVSSLSSCFQEDKEKWSHVCLETGTMPMFGGAVWQYFDLVAIAALLSLLLSNKPNWVQMTLSSEGKEMQSLDLSYFPWRLFSSLVSDGVWNFQW